MKFTFHTWDEIIDEWGTAVLTLPIDESEITADRLNLEWDKHVCGPDWPEDATESTWTTAASCQDGNSISMICRSDRNHLAFLCVTWEKDYD